MSTKTRIPFKNTQVTAQDGLPGAAEVVTLFNSVTAFGARNLQQHNIYWFTYSITPATNATGNSVTAQCSDDGGTNWIAFYASATNEPVGDSTTFTDEIFIGPYADVLRAEHDDWRHRNLARERARKIVAPLPRTFEPPC